MTKSRDPERSLGASWWPRRCPRPGSAGWDELPWPDGVPVLLPDDVIRSHRIPLDHPPYNLDGWLDAVFMPAAYTDRRAGWVELLAHLVVEVVLLARTGRKMASWEYSHEEGVTLADVASAWNEAMSLLGYDMTRPRKTRKTVKVNDYTEFFT